MFFMKRVIGKDLLGRDLHKGDKILRSDVLDGLVDGSRTITVERVDVGSTHPYFTGIMSWKYCLRAVSDEDRNVKRNQ